MKKPHPDSGVARRAGGTGDGGRSGARRGHVGLAAETQAGGPAGAIQFEHDPLALTEHAEDGALEGVGGEVVELRRTSRHEHLMHLVADPVGDGERHRDVPLAFWTQPSTADVAANSFEDTPAIMEFFEEDIGIPFPWAKYDQVTIQDFVAGGMENTSLTTLTDQTLHEKATETIRSSRSLDAHEMAHQWFGDLVTCKDWSHLWLNEGFATYYAHLYDGHKFGRDELLYQLWLDAEQRILPQGEDVRPIVWKGYKIGRAHV